MATWTECFALLLLSGCGVTQVDLLLVRGTSDPESFVCSDGTTVTVGTANNTAVCLGLTCGSADLSTYDCGNVASNAAAGTCVEAFFARCPIGGTCSELPNFGGNQYSNGAHTDTDGARYAPGETEPCAHWQKTDYGSPEETTWYAEKVVE